MNLEDKINKIENKVKKVENEKQSLAYEMILNQKKEKKLLTICFTILISLLIIYSGIITGYLIYLLNDIEVIETTETTEDYDINQNSGDGGNNNFINGNSNEVNN